MVTISAHHVSLTSSITAVLLTLKKQHGGSTRTEQLLNGAGVYKKKNPSLVFDLSPLGDILFPLFLCGLLAAPV